MDEHVLATYRRAPEVFVSGQGATLRDEHGRRFLDLMSGVGVSALGHTHPALTRALHDQVDQVLHVSNLYRHPLTEVIAQRVCDLTGLDSVFFCNSGTEAVEAALKIARKHHVELGNVDRTGFVALEGSFHGRTMGALSVTHGAGYRTPFEPLVPDVEFVAPGDATALRKALAAKPAALILEPIQGEGGIVELGHEYLQLARALCTETGTVLIHDEIQSGAGRTGKFLAADAAGVKPDIVTLAKPIACGLPMGLTVVAAELAETLQPGDHGSTFAGGPLACRAALVFLRELSDGLLDAVQERGAQFRAGLEALASAVPQITEVRGRGLMLGIRLSHDARALQEELHQRGLLTNCTAGDVVRFLPPYVITEAEIDEALTILGEALETLYGDLS